MEGFDLVPFESIDRLLLVEIRLPNMPAGLIAPLYAKARGDVPLSYATAKAFLDHPKAKVGIVTGVQFEPFLPHGEIDGLIGAVVLARAVGKLGGEAFVLTEKGVAPVIANLIKALGAPNSHAVNVQALSSKELADYANRMDMGVAIEKTGVNRKGIRHTIEGKAYDMGPDYANAFINALNAQGKTTVGYGDGGNEIGFGKIFDAARAIVPFGDKCQCPCGDGMVTATATTILWPVNVSNFGVYGTVAAMALLARDASLALSAQELLKALDVCIASGAVDGGTGLGEPGEDGIPAPAAAAFAQIMHSIVLQSFRTFERAF